MSIEEEKPKATLDAIEPNEQDRLAELFRSYMDDEGDISGALEAKDIALDRVQNELVQEKDSRKAERFYWIFSTVIALDLLFLKDFSNWSGPLVIGILQFAFIIALGRTLGVTQIWTLTERIIEKWSGYIKAPDDK